MILFDIITKIQTFKRLLQRSFKKLQERVSIEDKQWNHRCFAKYLPT